MIKLLTCQVCKKEKHVMNFLPGIAAPNIPPSKYLKICTHCMMDPIEGKKFLESDLHLCDRFYTAKQMCEHLAKYLKEHKYEWMMGKFGKEMSGEDIYNSYPNGDLSHIQSNFLAVCTEIGYPTQETK